MAKQLSFAEAVSDPRLGQNGKLDRIDGLVEWTALEPLARSVRRGTAGRPPFNPLSMLKALYLQAMYDLSDPGLEEALLDRLSFRRFCGFAMDQATPDETTIVRFRQDAAAAGVLEAAFAIIGDQLAAKGFMLKKGTLMDATLIAAKHTPPPHAAGSGSRHPDEPAAEWTKKNGKAHFGYKLHIGIDEGSGLVRRAVYTGAKTYESEVAEALISGDERAVYGDKAYEHKERRARLKQAGIKDRLMHRRHKYMAHLPRWQERRNQLIARRRAPVEAVFSAGKRLYGFARARYASFTANAARTLAALTAYNLRRVITLIEAADRSKAQA